jgi:hypothetical protein
MTLCDLFPILKTPLNHAPSLSKLRKRASDYSYCMRRREETAISSYGECQGEHAGLKDRLENEVAQLVNRLKVGTQILG